MATDCWKKILIKYHFYKNHRHYNYVTYNDTRMLQQSTNIDKHEQEYTSKCIESDHTTVPILLYTTLINIVLEKYALLTISVFKKDTIKNWKCHHHKRFLRNKI